MAIDIVAPEGRVPGSAPVQGVTNPAGNSNRSAEGGAAARADTSSNARQPYQPTYQFQTYEFIDTCGVRDVQLSASMRFANTVRDAVSGAESLAALLDWDADVEANLVIAGDPSLERQPLLNPFHRGALSRFLVVSLRMLHAETSRHSDFLARWAKEAGHG